MSMGDADAKFPNQSSDAIPPSPTRENPGQVYPKSDPKAAPPNTIPGNRPSNSSQSLIGNPFLMREAFGKLDHALGYVITTLESEENTMGGSQDENELLRKFQSWRDELDVIRAGKKSPERSRSRVRAEHEGGLFTD